jgi:hypothetical protein
MNSNQASPAGFWLWRWLTSRPARLLYLGVLLIVVLPAIALRIEAALFARHVHKIMDGLASLRIGETSKAEALSRLPELRPTRQSTRHADECFAVLIPNSKLSDAVLLRAGRSGYPRLFSALSLLGFRYWVLDARFNITAGKVSDLNYRLILNTPDNRYPSVITIAVSSQESIFGWKELRPITDESPDFKVSHYFKWPDLTTRVDFTSVAPSRLVQHAFDLKLSCMWFLVGCRTSNQVLPEVEQDRQNIERAANERMRGPSPCPEWIVRHRARDTDDILVVEVVKAAPEFVDTGYGVKYRLASFRLLKTLKGKPDRPLDNVGVSPDIQIGIQERVHNSAIDLLNLGEKIVLFSGGSTNIDEPCEAVAATEIALQTIEKALGTSQVAH